MLLSRLLYKMLFNFQSEELTWLKALTINNLLKYIDMYIFICRVPFMFPSTWIWTPHFHYLLWWSEVSDLYSYSNKLCRCFNEFFPSYCFAWIQTIISKGDWGLGSIKRDDFIFRGRREGVQGSVKIEKVIFDWWMRILMNHITFNKLTK